MDTRSKILTVAAACELSCPLVIVTGTFDILRAEHVRELERAKTEGQALMVIVLPSPFEWLSADARAEMVAALRVVDYVVAAQQEDLVQLSCAHPGAEVVHLETADARRARQLIEHVRNRQKC